VDNAQRKIPPEVALGASRGAPHRDLISSAWRHLAQERRSILRLGMLTVVAAQAESMSLVLIALIADSIARDAGDTDLVIGPFAMHLSTAAASSLAFVALVIAALLVFINGRLVARVKARLDREVRDLIVLSYAHADWEFQSTQKSSRAQGRLRLMGARASAFVGLVGWIRGAASIAVFVVVAAAMSPLAALIIVVFGGILSLAVLPIRLRTRRVARRTAEVDVALAEDFGEAIDQGPDVHVFGAWPAFISRFATRSRLLQDLREHTGKLQSLLPVVYQYGALTMILLILVAAAVFKVEGNVGSFAAAALLLLRSVQYGQMLQLSLHEIAKAVPTMEVLQHELYVPAPRVSPGRRALQDIEEIELRNVNYCYPGAERPALIDVSLHLRPSTIVGLAGPSGSGKSTLAQILLRLRWPTSGQYLVNGHDAEAYSAESWTRLVSHLPQQPHLLHGSLTENITYFNDSISRDQVMESLRAVGLDRLVFALPGGLDAELGPTGRSLSGGQVQRLGIARSLVRAPKLIVLDEPTSALDVAAERNVAEAINALRGRQDMIIVVIAHHASTLALCDEIVVLQGGQVTAVGRADDLALESDFIAATWASGVNL
jgi:ATP-binding cassette, subfamily B, bacterial